MLAKFVAGMVIITTASLSLAEELIVLRDLTLIKPTSIKSFDRDGVVIDTGKRFGWEQIEQVHSTPENQAKLNELQRQFSDPLFRIRIRLLIGDDLAAAEPAEKSVTAFSASTSESSALVFAGVVRGRIQARNRESAISPLLQYFKRESAGAADLPARIQLPIDAKSKICLNLLPIWFDESSAKKETPSLLKTVKANKDFPPEFQVYIGSLAIAAGDLPSANQAIDALSDDGIQAELKQLLIAQRELSTGENLKAIDQLKPLVRSKNRPIRVIALYWKGVAQAGGVDRQRKLGALTLLSIAAEHSDEFPDIAAAAMYQASKAIDFGKDDKQVKAIQQEIILAFPNTWHGQFLSKH